MYAFSQIYYVSLCFSDIAFLWRGGLKNLESPCAFAQKLEHV